MPDDTPEIQLEALGPKATAFEAGARVAPIVPRTLNELAMVAAAIINAGLAPDSYKVEVGTAEERERGTKSRIMIGIMKGAEVGLPPITALSTIAIINNRPCIWGDGAVALVQQSGQVVRFEQFFEGSPETDSGAVEDERGEKDYAPRTTDFPQAMTAVCRVWRKGQAAPYEGRFSVRDAMRAHLWASPKKLPWMQHPKRMLMARARAFALRDGFADCLMGLSIREEVEDLPPEAPARTDTDFLNDPPALPAPSEQPMGGMADDAGPSGLGAADRDQVGDDPVLVPVQPAAHGAGDDILALIPAEPHNSPERAGGEAGRGRTPPAQPLRPGSLGDMGEP